MMAPDSFLWSQMCGVTPQAKSTGQLSLLTALMSTAGCFARIFTSIQEGAGLSMVRGFCLGKNSTPFGCKPFGLETGQCTNNCSIIDVQLHAPDLLQGVLFSFASLGEIMSEDLADIVVIGLAVMGKILC